MPENPDQLSPLHPTVERLSEIDSLSPHLLALTKSRRFRGWALWVAKIGVPAVLVAAVYPTIDWVTHRANVRDLNALAIDVAHIKERTGADAVLDPETHQLLAPAIKGTTQTRLEALELLRRTEVDVQLAQQTALYEHWVSIAAATAEPRAALRAEAAARARAQFRSLTERHMAPADAADVVLETTIPRR